MGSSLANLLEVSFDLHCRKSVLTERGDLLPLAGDRLWEDLLVIGQAHTDKSVSKCQTLLDDWGATHP
jgi:hypothetical protein